MPTTPNARWIYLHDMHGSTTIMNLETKETREILSNQVKNSAPSGLRRYVLKELENGKFEETGEQVPITLELLEELNESFESPNNWIYDWPHLQIEQTSEADVARLKDILEKKMSKYPYKFEIVGLQRRFLMYFSDGDVNSQRYFERYIPRPNSPPYRLDGSLQGKYGAFYNSVMRDAKVPQHEAIPSRFHNHHRSPCVYTGSAWVVRFRLNDVDVLMERCRAYVDDDGNFIASDWCQRMGYSTYGNGINLQLGLFTFDAWTIGPCLQRNKENGNGAKFKDTEIVSVKHMKMPPPPPTAAEIAAQTKKLLAMAAPVNVSMLYADRQVPPITPEAMQEARKVLEQDTLASAAVAENRSRWCSVREFETQQEHEIRSVAVNDDSTLYLIPQAYTARQHVGYLQLLFMKAEGKHKYRMDAVLFPMPQVATPELAQQNIESLVNFYKTASYANLPIVQVPAPGGNLFGPKNECPAQYPGSGAMIAKDNKAYQALLYFVERVVNAPNQAEAKVSA